MDNSVLGCGNVASVAGNPIGRADCGIGVVHCQFGIRNGFGNGDFHRIALCKVGNVSGVSGICLNEQNKFVFCGNVGFAVKRIGGNANHGALQGFANRKAGAVGFFAKDFVTDLLFIGKIALGIAIEIMESALYAVVCQLIGGVILIYHTYGLFDAFAVNCHGVA